MITKSDKVREFVKQKDYKSALKIAKDFRIGFTNEEISVLRRGYECFIYPQFYKQIGIDLDTAKQNAINILIKIYR